MVPATVTDAASPGGEVEAVFVLAIDDCRLAVPLSTVQTVTRAVAVTALPKAPAVVDGVIDLHGKLVPVLDVRSRFGLAPRALSPTEHFLIASAGKRTVALRADRALEVMQIPCEQIERIDGVVANTDYVAGVAKLADGLVLIHDLETFLSAAEAKALDGAIEAAAGTGATA